jgi:hypothetical protein
MRQALRNITPELCASTIGHTIKLMDDFLQSDQAGSLRRFGSMARLMKVTPEERHACTDLDVVGAHIVSDAAEEEIQSSSEVEVQMEQE